MGLEQSEGGTTIVHIGKTAAEAVVALGYRGGSNPKAHTDESPMGVAFQPQHEPLADILHAAWIPVVVAFSKPDSFAAIL